MGTQRTRESKIGWMEMNINDALARADFILIDGLLSAFAYEMKSSKRTGREIIDMLRQMGKIRIKNGMITK